MWNQRSADACCGIPFNIASYALLLNIIAKMTGKIPLELIGNFGDTHIYKNHIDSAKVQLKERMSVYSRKFMNPSGKKS